MIHYARAEHSRRLQRVLGVLSDRRWHTTREIIRLGQVCAVNTIVSELRRNGFVVECQCVTTGVYQYRLVR